MFDRPSVVLNFLFPSLFFSFALASLISSHIDGQFFLVIPLLAHEFRLLSPFPSIFLSEFDMNIPISSFSPLTFFVLAST